MYLIFPVVVDIDSGQSLVTLTNAAAFPSLYAIYSIIDALSNFDFILLDKNRLLLQCVKLSKQLWKSVFGWVNRVQIIAGRVQLFETHSL